MKKLLLVLTLNLIVLSASSQAVQWAKKYSTPGTYATAEIAVSPVQGIAIAGYYFSYYSTSGLILYKLDTSGTISWGDTIYQQNPNYVDWNPMKSSAITFNNSGSLFFGGDFSDTLNADGTIFPAAATPSFFLTKYDQSGSKTWFQTYSNASLNDIHTDASGSTFLLIAFNAPLTFFGQTFVPAEASDLLIAKLDAADNLVFSKQLHGNLTGVQLTTSASGNIFVLGKLRDTLYFDTHNYAWSHSPYNDYFMLKMSSSGSFVDYIPVSTASIEQYSRLTLSADEKVMITGESCWTNGCHARFKSYDASGTSIVDSSWWGETCDYGCDFIYQGVAGISNSEVWAVTREFNNLVPGNLNDDWENIAIRKYDYYGNAASPDTFLVSVPNSENFTDMAWDNDQHLYLAGQLKGNIQFESHTITNSDTTADFFLVKLNTQLSTGINEPFSFTSRFDIFPNPSENILNLRFTSDHTRTLRIIVKNVLGQVIYTDDKKDIINYAGQIDLGQQPKGIYFFEVQADSEKLVKKVILN